MEHFQRISCLCLLLLLLILLFLLPHSPLRILHDRFWIILLLLQSSFTFSPVPSLSRILVGIRPDRFVLILSLI